MLARFHFSFSRIFLCAIMVLFFAFGCYHLTQFETADEHYWVSERIPQYWQALKDGQYKKTLINDKPGVSVTLVSGIALHFFDDVDYYTPLSQEKNIPPKQLTPQETQRIFLAFRLPLLIINALLLLYFFWAIKILFRSRSIALGSVFCIALSPILIGISQIINPDALLWSFGFASMLSLLLFLQKNSLTNALLTAFFFALALLSKYTAMVFVPLFVAFAIFHSFFHKPKQENKEVVRDILQRNILGLGIIFFISMVVVSFFLPAILIKPRYLLDLTLSFSSSMPYILMGSVAVALIAFIINAYCPRQLIQKILSIQGRLILLIPFSLILFLAIIRPTADLSFFSKLSFDIRNISIDTTRASLFDLILLEYNPFVFSLQPLVLGLLLFTWGKYIFIRHLSRTRFTLIVLFTLPFIAIPFGYLISDTIATIRYLILLYPLAGVIAAIGGAEIFEWLSKKYSSTIASVTVILSVIVLCISTFNASPFYFNYTNALLPKNKIITDAWGYGGYEAAQYINSQPHADTLIVWSDYYGVCPFIKGTCITNYSFDQNAYPIDYYVITRRGSIRFNYVNRIQTPDLSQAYKYYDKAPVWQLFIDNRPNNFIKVIRAK